MRLRPIVIALAAGITVLAAGPASGTAQTQTDTPWGVGFQSSWPSYGLSVLYDVSDQITAQGILGALGTVTNFGGRLLYRFQREPNWNLFGYGAVGLLHWGGGSAHASESVIGVGGGAGIELDWSQIISPDDGSFPPLFSTIEIGFTAASWERYTGFSGLTMGAGIHYRF